MESATILHVPLMNTGITLITAIPDPTTGIIIIIGVRILLLLRKTFSNKNIRLGSQVCLMVVLVVVLLQIYEHDRYIVNACV